MSRAALLSFALATLIACDTREGASAVSQAAATCPPVTWTLLGGDPNVLMPGDVVTNPRDLVLENGIVRLTYEAMWNDPSTPVQDEAGAHMLYRWHDGEYRRALSSRYGDWTFFANPFLESAATATVLSASEDAVEIAFEWPEHRLDVAGPYNGCYHGNCGVVERDHQGEPIFRADGSGELVVIDHVRFVKTVRIERCSEGYYAGYHSDPRLSPKNGLEGNNENSMGEREIGTGGGNVVTFSSAGVVVRNPEAGQHTWLGIDDPPYVADPKTQTEGPWWVADLPGFSPPDDIPFARFIALEHRLEVGVWQFGSTHLGSTVVHYVNSEIEADGRSGRYQVFIGAFPYASQSLDAEPTPALYDGVIARLPVTWPN